jgi:hypothetical protein
MQRRSVMRLGATLVTLALVVCLATCAGAVEKQAFRFREDFGTAPLSACNLQYYYYIPCPSYSWFWGFYDWEIGDIIGQFFTVGDSPTGGDAPCDPETCEEIEMTGFSFIDFAGYGGIYPGLFTIEFEVYCSDESGCPVGPALWNSGPIETISGWNDILVVPPLALTGCGSPAPRCLLAAIHTGTDATYPQWGFDNISGSLSEGCSMHDIGCLPGLYPRPYNSNYSDIHSGYYGIDFEFCPPYGFLDGLDTTEDGSVYGFLELAWKIQLNCSEPATDPGSWGKIKAMYR